MGRTLDELYPRYRVSAELEELDLARHADVDAAIVAYPHGAAAPVVAELRGRAASGWSTSPADFRLTERDVYERWYGDHGAPDLFGTGAYGLPELHRDEIAGAELVANPGCFPTAALLALAPLARTGLVAGAVIDAKTGVSGAGRAATDTTHFVSVDENVSAYGVAGHRHGPEIDQELALLGSRPGRPSSRTCSHSTRRAALPLRRPRRSRPTRRRSRGCSPTPTPASRSWRS